MPLLTGCCCFATLKNGAKATAAFTVLTAICNFILDVALLSRLTTFRHISEPQEIYLYIPPGMMVFLSIEMVLTILMLPIGLLLLVGINFGYEGKRFVVAWVIFMSLDRFFDSFLGVYTLAWIGGHRFRDVLYPLPEVVIVTVYWMINTIVLVAGMLCVVSYWQQLKDELFGKERRVKHFNKLANIRQAALSGSNTPYKSYYSSRSMLTLAPSQASLAHA